MYTATKKWDEVDVNGPSRRLNQNSHVPVLVKEVLSWLACRPGGRYLDCTVGQGGLASSILDLTGPDGSVIGIDQDE
ncbi:MAG: 16S rRNA (cytosine(1402)-N(4))-methyltransferase, partial [Candidatus Methylomirabilaceae bacterium]